MKQRQIVEGRALAVTMLTKAGLLFSPEEIRDMEVGDFGLNNWPTEGAQIVTLLSTPHVGLKVICLLPGQSLPEHWHTGEGDYPGKEETIRVLDGDLELGLPGDQSDLWTGAPAGKVGSYTCRRVLRLCPPSQLTLQPGTKHWMRGGIQGAIVLSISTMATCARDPFTDPAVKRFPPVDMDD